MNGYLNKHWGDYYSIKYPVDYVLRDYIDNYTLFRFFKDKLCCVFYNSFPNINIELLLHHGNSSMLIRRDDNNTELKHFLKGIFDIKYNSAIMPSTKDSYYKCLYVQFKLASFIQFTNVPLKEIRNRFSSLSDIWGRSGKVLEDFIDNCENVMNITDYLNVFFQSKINSQLNGKKSRLQAILKYSNSLECVVTIEDITNYFKISYRTLHRIFRTELGMSPKQYIELLRFNKVCRLLQNYPSIRWSDLVFNCGYYDQAHLIKDFKNIMNCTPEKFLRHTQGKFYIASSAS